MRMGVTSHDTLNKNHLSKWLDSAIHLDSKLELFYSKNIVDTIEI